MSNLLTATEAAQYVRTEDSDPVLLMLLPQIDAYVQAATGRDWTADETTHPMAKTAAGILLVAWYDDPAQVGSPASNASAALMQLEAEALKYRKSVFYGRDGAGAISLTGALVGDEVIKLVGVYGSTGDQSADFESVISETGEIQQIDVADLSENIYVVVLKSPADDVIP